MDVHEPEVRSYNMSRIKSRDTKPELIVRKFLFNKGFRYRVNDKRLPGKPDIVLPKYKLAIFVHGCFWHGHDKCNFAVIPKTRTEWWLRKIHNTKKRDLENIYYLRNLDWRIHTIFECELKNDKRDKTLAKLLDLLKSNEYTGIHTTKA